MTLPETNHKQERRYNLVVAPATTRLYGVLPGSAYASPRYSGDVSEQYMPAQAAQQLELSASMMRRYHLSLERVLGEPLPRHEVSNGRMIDGEHLRLLLAARELVTRDKSLSVENALRQLLSTPAVPPLSSSLQGSSADLTPLLGAIERQSQEIAALREEVTGLRQQLRALNTPKERAPRLRDEAIQLLRRLREKLRG